MAFFGIKETCHLSMLSSLITGFFEQFLIRTACNGMNIMKYNGYLSNNDITGVAAPLHSIDTKCVGSPVTILL